CAAACNAAGFPASGGRPPGATSCRWIRSRDLVGANARRRARRTRARRRLGGDLALAGVGRVLRSRRRDRVRPQAGLRANGRARRLLPRAAPRAAHGRGSPSQGAARAVAGTAALLRPRAWAREIRAAVEPGRAEARALARVGGGALNLSLQDLQREAAATGFPAETLEK